MSLRFPRPLRPGDRIGVTAPSAGVQPSSTRSTMSSRSCPQITTRSLTRKVGAPQAPIRSAVSVFSRRVFLTSSRPARARTSSAASPASRMT